MEILAGLQSAAIYRLKKTWEVSSLSLQTQRQTDTAHYTQAQVLAHTHTGRLKLQRQSIHRLHSTVHILTHTYSNSFHLCTQNSPLQITNPIYLLCYSYRKSIPPPAVVCFSFLSPLPPPPPFPFSLSSFLSPLSFCLCLLPKNKNPSKKKKRG